MTFKTTTTTIGSAVASGGTFTISYPAGTNAGTFAAYGHKIHFDKFQNTFSSPESFTLSFGASDITATYNGSTTIPAETVASVQLNIAGVDGDIPLRLNADDATSIKRSTLSSIVNIDLGAADTADANGYVESQDLTAAGVFSVNTTATAAIAAAALGGSADVPRNVVAAWTTSAVLTVTGTDEYGNTIVESSASGTSFTGSKAFATVTDISVSADVTGLTVGTGNKLGLPVYIDDAARIVQEYIDGASVGKKAGVVFVQDRLIEADVDAGTPLNISSPVDGKIKSLRLTVDGSVTTGGAVTVEVNTTAVDGLSVTVADGATEGQSFSDTATIGHTSANVAAGDRIEIIPAAAFNASNDIQVILEIETNADGALDGLLTVGDAAKATATTGDIRGTYEPVIVPNGTSAVSLVAVLPDPEYKGVDQYAG